MPRTLLPMVSMQGDQTQRPSRLGTTSKTTPDTPDLAGSPTYKYTFEQSLITTLDQTGRVNRGRPEETHPEGELARIVVHAAREHEPERVAHSFCVHNALASHRAVAPVSERRSDHRACLAGYLNRTELRAFELN